MRIMEPKRGFTLIELLIVVAIIAILAAIAVPNFLEAQTRAKISRFMADLRSAAVALEAYAVDNNRYPPPDAVPAGADESIAGPWWPVVEDPQENYLPRRLTTPIAYITSLPGDPFAHGGDGFPKNHTPHYINDQFNSTWADRPWSGNVELEFYVARTMGALKLATPNVPLAAYDRSVTWLAHSHGPDLDHDDFGGDAGYPVQYDPTNGTISDGDIFYFGPGTGFFGR